MARIFMAGFEDGSIFPFVKNAGSIAASTTQKRTGAYSVYRGHEDPNCYAIASLVTTYTEVYFRYGLYLVGDVNHVPTLMFIDSTAAILACVVWNYKANLLEFHRGTSTDTILGSTALGSIVPGNWYCVEGHLKIDNASGVADLKVNGTQLITYAGDTQVSGTANIAGIRIYGDSWGGQVYMDDIAINDTTGSVNNSWIGQGGIRPLLVNADGDHTGLTPSTGTDNYALVDEVPASDTDYVSGSTKDVYDLYTVDTSGMPASYTVSAVKWIARARVTEDAANITPVIRSESTTEQQSDIALSTSFTVKELIMETDPIDDAAWTKTKIDALEIGAAVG